MERYEIRLSGAGGQGLILSGIILAESIIRFTTKNAIQTQSYGPEARGGASKSEVIVSSGEIDYPKVRKPDLLLALTQEAYNKYNRELKEYGIIIVDENVYIAPRSGPTYSFPILKTAREKFGRDIFGSMISLGIVVGLVDLVSPADVEKVVIERVPRGTEETNRKAIYTGLELLEDLEKYEIQTEEEEEEK